MNINALSCLKMAVSERSHRKISSDMFILTQRSQSLCWSHVTKMKVATYQCFHLGASASIKLKLIFQFSF